MISAKTEALLRSLFAVDENGNTYLRVVGDTFSGGELSNAVSARSNRSLDTLFANAVVLDTDGNPALRLAEVSYGMTPAEKEKARRMQAAGVTEPEAGEEA